MADRCISWNFQVCILVDNLYSYPIGVRMHFILDLNIIMLKDSCMNHTHPRNIDILWIEPKHFHDGWLSKNQQEKRKCISPTGIRSGPALFEGTWIGGTWTRTSWSAYLPVGPGMQPESDSSPCCGCKLATNNPKLTEVFEKALGAVGSQAPPSTYMCLGIA